MDDTLNQDDLLALEEVYEWVDSVPFSRPKRNLARDFSDGVMMAELLHHWYPKLVDMHNYYPANAHQRKIKNWTTLNKKVLKRLDIGQSVDSLNLIASGTTGAIDPLLKALKRKVDARENSGSRSSDPATYSVGDCTSIPESFEDYKLTINRLQAQLSEKDDAITVLNNKVAHLESMLDLKERRIKEMLIQLQSHAAKEARLRDLTAQLSRSCPEAVTAGNKQKQLLEAPPPPSSDEH